MLSGQVLWVKLRCNPSQRVGRARLPDFKVCHCSACSKQASAREDWGSEYGGVLGTSDSERVDYRMGHWVADWSFDGAWAGGCWESGE